MRDDLDAQLLAAHAADDRGALVRLYAEAGDAAEVAGDRDRAAFYLTHAYVFALEAGDARAEGLHVRLKGWGREE
ncbi:MAG: hypothetical protein AAFO80_02990 [Pseudomonadota bacterium]